jgi:hypothetical protein
MGRTDGSVTISFHNFVGEGIKSSSNDISLNRKPLYEKYNQVKYLGEGICHTLPLFSLDLESMIRNNVKIHSNLHVSQCVNLTVDRWPGFQILLRTKYVPSLVKIH